MCPFTTLPPSEGPNRFSPTSVKDWQPRRKSVSNACERCRRRKIRCDGDTPCATCKRFSLQCVRTQKPKELVASEHREALEDRIHQLESQLAAHVNAPMHGMEGIDETILAATSDFNWQDTGPPPPINLGTTFANSFETGGMDLSAFTQSSMPMIAINQCEHVPNVASPSSPVPSFWSGTTRASSPDMPPTSVPPQFASIPPHLRGSKPSTSPLEPHTAPSWEFMAQPQSGQKTTARSRTHSRNTSNSSASLESEDQAMSPIPEVDDDLLPFAASTPHLPRHGVFAPSPAPASTRSGYTDRSRAISTTPLPSRFEAETLTSEFMQHIKSHSPQAYGMPASSFLQLCEMVYPNSQKASPSMLMASMSMARFHVFLAMATGMKLRIKDSPESTNALLDTCYDLAMQQTTTSTFWQEDGGVEAAQLLAVFAGIRKTPIIDPTPLTHSFTW
ncbi:hypothetical protein C7974DRAFT_66162 [Boeremia exigua]|uniref:uncharacterized protein n=1 Tax=Boeremia exigua TaxID=749465 RepID=UPI001E8EF3A9|nr:uncharacterized protein C7974DRAFT_66162 [Boeremia exigua]KAH6613880.1 hypothetical protein C7974DRAFT_66162 [Boeremia exigua]